MARKPPSFVILASGVCSNYMFDFAATGFVLDPASDPGPGGAYCDRCGRKIAAEYCEKIELGWSYQPGKIHGNLAERPPTGPEPLEVSSRPADNDDCAFLSYVVDRLTT